MSEVMANTILSFPEEETVGGDESEDDEKREEIVLPPPDPGKQQQVGAAEPANSSKSETGAVGEFGRVVACASSFF